MADTQRVLIKLRNPGVPLAAAPNGRAKLEPLFDTSPQAAGFGLQDQPTWYVAHLEKPTQNPWDNAHAQISDQLGISDDDVLFAEPDLAQVNRAITTADLGQAEAFALGADCPRRIKK